MTKPSILIVLFDQLQRAAMGCYGGAAPTPNWDRLCAHGARFDRAYCSAPLSVPSRASMLTGQFAHAHGALCSGEGYDLVRPGIPLLTHRLLDAGYRVAYEGVCPVWGAPDDRGNEQLTHFIERGFPYDGHRRMLAAQGGNPAATTPLVRTFDDDGREVQWTFSVPIPAVWTDSIEEIPDMQSARSIASFIRGLGPNESFAAWCSFGGPHPPLVVPEPFFSLFKASDMAVPAGFEPLPPNEPPAISGTPGRQAIRDWTWAQWAPGAAAYMGYVAFVDHCLGVVLDAAKDRDTLIVATADHGEMLGAHRLYQKEAPYERAAAVPLVFAGPGVKAGPRRQLASGVDLAPTVLDLLDLPPLPHVHGQSLRPVLADATAAARDSVMITFDGEVRGGVHWRALATDRHKYVLYNDGREQLFDLEDDPEELHDLSAKATFSPVRTKCREEMARWMRDTGDFLAAPAD